MEKTNCRRSVGKIDKIWKCEKVEKKQPVEARAAAYSRLKSAMLSTYFIELSFDFVTLKVFEYVM